MKNGDVIIKIWILIMKIGEAQRKMDLRMGNFGLTMKNVGIHHKQG